MAIYDRLMGWEGIGGHVVLLCKECKAPAQDAKSTGILKVCSKCGMPLGEWKTEAERDAELKDFEGWVRRAGTPVMKLSRIRIKSGQHAGRYVGMRFGGGLAANPEVQKNPPANVPGSDYGLWAQERGAAQFFEGKAELVQAELERLGYETELIRVR